MYMDMNGPPIVEYEKVVSPIEVTSREAKLKREDGRDDFSKRRRPKKRKKALSDDKDVIFEPFLGKLFDYSA